MQMQFSVETRAAPEAIWPYYVEPAKRYVWDKDLENIEFDGPQRAGA
jgi:hypothetical protein